MREEVQGARESLEQLGGGRARCGGWWGGPRCGDGGVVGWDPGEGAMCLLSISKH